MTSIASCALGLALALLAVQAKQRLAMTSGHSSGTLYIQKSSLMSMIITSSGTAHACIRWHRKALDSVHGLLM